MEKIMKKALDEALTERYSGELNSASEANHAFSGDFERKMKALIRRTDKPLLYYSKYIAAAACAVVAIGCAVLLPALSEAAASGGVVHAASAFLLHRRHLLRRVRDRLRVLTPSRHADPPPRR